jgi:hypothetical protein
MNKINSVRVKGGWSMSDFPVVMNQLKALRDSLEERQEDLDSSLREHRSLVKEQRALLKTSSKSDSVLNYVRYSATHPKVGGALSKKDWGRLMGTLSDACAREIIESKTSIRFYDEEELDRDANASGYDLKVKTARKPRLQVKFRQCKNPKKPSGTYLETTRRHSDKNVGAASKNGQVAYSMDEFDGLFIINADENDRDPSNWTFSVILVSELKDEENPGFIRARIGVDTVRSGLDWRVKLNAFVG